MVESKEIINCSKKIGGCGVDYQLSVEKNVPWWYYCESCRIKEQKAEQEREEVLKLELEKKDRLRKEWEEQKEVGRLKLVKEVEEKRTKGEAVIFVDGARNNWGGKYGIADELGQRLDQGNNGQISEQIEIEAYAILKGVNWAIAEKVKSLRIMTDSKVLSYGDEFKSKTKAGKYYWLAKKIAKESDIELSFEWVAGSENKADYLTRK